MGGPNPDRDSPSRGRTEVPRLLSGLPQGCRLIPASWWYFSFFLSGALFFLIKITMEGSRRLSFTTSQHLGPSSASVGKNVPCHRGCLPLFEVSG